MGAGGENCQCSTAWPGATAHRPIRATLKMPVHPHGQLLRAIFTQAREPGPTVMPRKVQLPGPLHTSFCAAESKVLKSPVTVLVGMQALSMPDTLAFCSIEFVKVR